MCRDGSSALAALIRVQWTVWVPPPGQSHRTGGRAPTPGWVLGRVPGGDSSAWDKHPVLQGRISPLSWWAVVPPWHVPAAVLQDMSRRGAAGTGLWGWCP